MSIRKKQSEFVIGGLAACLTIVVGCQNSTRRTTVADPDLGRPDSGIPNYSTYRYHYPTAAPVVDAPELKRLIDRHRHQVVVLSFWATWSVQSRSEIERLAELTEKHREKGLRVIACSFDEPEAWNSRVVPMLQATGANFPCVMLPSGERPAMKDWLGGQWSAEVPARFVVDRRGRTITRSTSEETILAALGTWGPLPERTRYARGTTTPTYGSTEPRTERTATSARSYRPRYSTTASASSERSATSTEATYRSSYVSSRTKTADATSTSTSTTRPYRGRRIRTVADTESVTTVGGGITVQAKVINVATGEAWSLPAAACELEDPDCLADPVATSAAVRMERYRNPRIAILPFARADRREDTIGLETAIRVRDNLLELGFYDLISPKRSESIFERAGLTPMKAEFEPESVRGKVRADYIILGRIRANDTDRTRRTYFAGDGFGGDEGYTSPRRDEVLFTE